MGKWKSRTQTGCGHKLGHELGHELGISRAETFLLVLYTIGFVLFLLC